MKLTSIALCLLSCSMGLAQVRPATGGQDRLTPKLPQTQTEPVSARIKDVARFRGSRINTIIGVGLVVGLNGTGDSKKNSFTTDQIANLLKSMGRQVSTLGLEIKNVATVTVMATLPPFARNGQSIDITVSSLGDAKSLTGGVLLPTTLHAYGDPETIFATAQGPLILGGFSVAAGGNSNTKGGQTTTGTLPGGATVERGANTKMVYDGKILLDLDSPDFTNAQRVEQRIKQSLPTFQAVALDATTIEVTAPINLSPVQALSMLEELKIDMDSTAEIVINERTGTIIMGGDLKIGAASIIHGSLTVEIREDEFVSQPQPLSNGTTEKVKTQDVKVKEDPAKLATFQNTTVADLGAIFEQMKLTATDVISILQALKAQGALKARITVR